MFQKYNLSAFTFISFYFEKVPYLGSSVRGFKGTRISHSPSVQTVVELFHMLCNKYSSVFFKHPWTLSCVAYS